MKTKNRIIFYFFYIFIFIFTNNLILSKKKNISKSNADFISKVRYIISKAEKKFFYNLPDNKRNKFIEQFWASRDTDSSTEENEFKEEYLHRILIANRKFSSGREGWLTDRGKTYILLGPPRHISDYPNGNFNNRNPFEIWHYPETYLYFIDYRNLGDYTVHYTSLTHQAMVHNAFIEAKRNNIGMSGLFNYKYKIINKKNKSFIVFTFNTDKLEFKKNNNKMETNFEIVIKVRDKDYINVFAYNKTHKFSIDLSNSNTKIPENFQIKIPLNLIKGKYLFQTSVKKNKDKTNFQNQIFKIK